MALWLAIQVDAAEISQFVQDLTAGRTLRCSVVMLMLITLFGSLIFQANRA
jgi:hypothetical protein